MMERAARLARRLALALALPACAGPAPGDAGPVAAAPSDSPAYLVRRGWHTDIVLSRDALMASAAMPEAADFPGARLLEFGWGDRAYYMAESPGAVLALRAALVPTDAVLHVTPIAALARGPDVVSLDLSPRAHDALVRAVSASFDRSDLDRASPLGAGLFEGALFYPATGRFHLFNTCNSWAARMLAAADLDAGSGVWGAATLMRRARAESARPREPDASASLAGGR
jgi:uncharacterized protein (TIGR02117 family)